MTLFIINKTPKISQIKREIRDFVKLYLLFMVFSKEMVNSEFTSISQVGCFTLET